MNATTRINDQGQTVTQVPGQPGTVTTGRPSTPPEFGATGLDRDFFVQHEDRLNETGRELIRQPLIDAWRRRGYHVTLLCHHDCAADPESVDDPPAGIYIEVRQEAANEVPWDAEFADAAGLTDEYQRGSWNDAG